MLGSSAIENFASHSYQVASRSVFRVKKTVQDVVNKVALNILILAICSAPLLYLHHNLFAVGFAFGLVFDKRVQDVVGRVNTVYSARRSHLGKILFYSIGGTLALLTMPTSMIMATIYYSSQCGALLYQKSFAAAPHPSGASASAAS